MQANINIARTLRIVDDLDKEGIRIPLLIMSHPGFGKTTTVRKYCELYDYNLVTVIPSQSAPDDILGIQSVKNGELTRLTPSWFNRILRIMENKKRTILFLDEITTTDPYTMGPLLDLIFSRSLGEKTLPDNVLIIAAGNYSKDLNNVFKMSAPLVNRFLILNLWNEDYDLSEVLEGTINTIKKENLKDFLGVDSTLKNQVYSYEAFKNWIKSSREIGFGKSEFEEDDRFGLINFTSIRSLSYSLKFMEKYVSIYPDGLWMRVVGDTLGTSYKREGKLLREILEMNEINFRNTERNAGKNPYKSVSDCCNHLLKADLPDIEDLRYLYEIVKNTSATDFSTSDFNKMKEVTFKWPRNDTIIYINDTLSKKLAM